MINFIKRIEQTIGLSIKIFFITSVIVVLFGIYVANLIYGNASLTITNRLESERLMLINEIAILKEENAILHKRYLEWEDVNQ
jgi:hypothetical protein